MPCIKKHSENDKIEIFHVHPCNVNPCNVHTLFNITHRTGIVIWPGLLKVMPRSAHLTTILTEVRSQYFLTWEKILLSLTIQRQTTPPSQRDGMLKGISMMWNPVNVWRKSAYIIHRCVCA